ncbi:MAG: lytic transglycosylase domain-containing protein [Alphaproteobacteria bacterium]|nr:lytic transglycosylase domain-containing protein [Alphaproteobacteria bacterium]
MPRRLLWLPIIVALLAHAVIGTSSPARAATPPIPTPRPTDGLGVLPPGDAAWRATIAYAERGDWAMAMAVQGRTPDPALAAVLEWLWLSDRKRPASFERVRLFLADNPDWPDEKELIKRAEQTMPAELALQQRLDWFETYPPHTTDGRILYLRTIEETGDPTRLQAEVKRIWRNIELGRRAEATFIKRWGNLLTQDDHISRLDEMLWRGRAGAARLTLKRVPKDWRLLADARLRLRFNKAGVDAAVNRVPETLLGDPGLHYERMRWRRRHGLATAARELLLEAPPAEEFLSLWWRERIWHIRESIDDGDLNDAYLLAASHKQTKGAGFAEAEWLAGWIALRFMNKPEVGLRHFGLLYAGVTTPISLGRAAYWAGRAAEQLKSTDDARSWYGRAAAHVTTFYGQLAAARLGAEGPDLPPAPAPDIARLAEIRGHPLVRASEVLIRVERRELAERFLRTLARRADQADHAAHIAEIAAANGFTGTAVYTARKAAQKCLILTDRGYPFLSPQPDAPPEPALVHAIIRQESGFDSGAISRVGARGLMQLMPATAKQTARNAGLKYVLGDLLTEPDYNITLGRRYLTEMLARFDGHYVLAIAAYNAGPHRVARWIKRHGHPNDPSVDVVDWIERIPFSETRNYVQRVLEALHVYRSRLSTNARVALRSTPGASGPQDVWCVYACGVLLDRQQAALRLGRDE